MTVADLIYLLYQHDSAATVVLWDYGPYKALVSKLGVGELQPIQLGTRESIGLLVLEPWSIDRHDSHGPFPGVVLGSKERC